MRNRKVYGLVLLLSREEIDRFDHFLASPYHNTSPTLQDFWKLFKDRVLGSNTATTEEDFVRGTSVKLSRIDALCWELMTQVKRFLAMERISDAPALEKLAFTDWLLKADPGLKEAERFLPQVQKDLNRLPASPEKELALFYFQAQSDLAEIKVRRPGQDWLQRFVELREQLERYHAAKALQLDCGRINARHIFKTDPVEDFPPSAIDSLQKLDLSGKLFAQTLQILSDTGGPEVYLQILATLEESREEIDKDIRLELLAHCLNFGIRKINQGDELFLRGTFELYRYLFRHRELENEGQVSPQHFKNMVAIACRLQETNWAENFIETHSPQLPPSSREMDRAYNKAILFFHQKKYSQSITACKEIIEQDPEDIFYGLDARVYLWKSFFEHMEYLDAEEVDEMFRLYDSFRMYVKRNKKIAPSHRQQYGNFIRFFKSLLNALEKPDADKRKRALSRLYHKVKASPGLSNQTWFTQKLEEALQHVGLGDRMRSLRIKNN